MSKSYQEHFDERGSAYDRAMRNFPAARELEFKQAIRAAEVVTGMTVADVPAGGLKDTEREIEAQLGIDSLPGGKVGMRWQLMTIVVSKD